MSLDRVSELYYTASEARDVLGLKENTFQTWIKTGKIKRTKLPGLGQGVYLKREIDRKAQLIEAAMFLDATEDLEYKHAALADVDAEIHLAHLIYGKRAMKQEAQRARKRLVELSPESSWYLYDRDMLAASINIVPVTHDVIEKFRQGERGWLFIDEKHIKQFEPGEPLELIVIDLMTTPAVPPEKRTFYAQVLLRELSSKTLKEWGARGVEISKMYTCGSTDNGRRMLRSNKEFEELGEPKPHRVIFEFDVEQNKDSILLRDYLEARAVWRGKH